MRVQDQFVVLIHLKTILTILKIILREKIQANLLTRSIRLFWLKNTWYLCVDELFCQRCDCFQRAFYLFTCFSISIFLCTCRKLGKKIIVCIHECAWYYSWQTPSQRGSNVSIKIKWQNYCSVYQCSFNHQQESLKCS